mmetsp:Transcript_21808/g.62102  ORF Transcript_21808/g.62102 Transcript_21808/m.62102 type:complete len:214 (-) Transcript_21808:164-805(-)
MVVSDQPTYGAISLSAEDDGNEGILPSSPSLSLAPPQSGDENSSNTMIPRELTELHEVDMDAEDMDPLEWTIRKLIPIPCQYYWENDRVTPQQVPLRLKMWHRVVGALDSGWKFLEGRVGTPLVNATGVTSSQFDYVTSTMSERDWEYSRTAVSRRKTRQNADERELQQNQKQGYRDNHGEEDDGHINDGSGGGDDVDNTAAASDDLHGIEEP